MLLFGTVRADIQDGRFDDGEYDLDLDTDGNDDREFRVTLAVDDDNPDRVRGDVEQRDDADEVTDRCDLSLKRLSQTDD